MKKLNFCFLCALCALCALHVDGKELADVEELPTVLEVRKAFTEANGGVANIQSIQSLIVSGTMVTDGNKYEFKVYRKRPNLMRMRVDTEEFSVETLFDGQQAYRRAVKSGRKGEYKTLGAAKAKLLAQDSHIESPFFVLSERPGNLSLVGKENVGELECYRFDVSKDSGSLFRSIWISTEDYLEVKHLREVTTGSGVSELQSSYFSNFRKQDDLWLAETADSYRLNGEKVQTVQIHEFRANVGIYDRFFEID